MLEVCLLLAFRTCLSHAASEKRTFRESASPSREWDWECGLRMCVCGCVWAVGAGPWGERDTAREKILNRFHKSRISNQ